MISRSQSTEESALCQPGTQGFCKQQMEWGGEGGHPSTLLHWPSLQELELELTGRWRGLLLSHNPVITHRCLSKSRRVHSLWGQSMLSGNQTGMDGVIREDDHLGAVTILHFGGETSGLIVPYIWVSQHTTLSDALLVVGFFKFSIPRTGGTTTGLFYLQAMET